jgi:hypothetical protein
MLTRWLAVRGNVGTDRSISGSNSTMYLHMYFDEPVALLNVTGLAIHSYDKATGYSESVHPTPTPMPVLIYRANGEDAVTYAKHNTEIIVRLADYCISASGSLSEQCAAGGGDTFFEVLDAASNTEFGVSFGAKPYVLYMSVLAEAAVDFASHANLATAQEGDGMLVEGMRLCYANAPCESGYYMSVECSAAADRVCTPCSASCASGFFIYEQCSYTRDTLCKLCGTCLLSTYITRDCGAGASGSGSGNGLVVPGVAVYGEGNDVQCGDCTTCGRGQYETGKCGLGEDRTCASCDK